MSKNECPICHGQGSYDEQVQWSDGLGIARAVCGLCEGKGEIEVSPAALALRYKEQAASFRADLEKLRTHVMLFKACRELDEANVTEPDERDSALRALSLRLATRPAVWTKTWQDYLDQAASLAPRE